MPVTKETIERGLAPIRTNEVYPLEVLMDRTGLGRTAMREARRKGLKVMYMHGRAFVHGRDYCDYMTSQSRDSKNG